MHKHIGWLVLATALQASILSGCNGGSPSASAAMVPNAAPATSEASAASAVVDAPNRPHIDSLSTADLHAGGSGFPMFAFNGGVQPAGCALTGCTATSPGALPFVAQAPPAPGSLFASAKTRGRIFYCGADSGTGIKTFVDDPAHPNETWGPCAPLGSTPIGLGAPSDPPDFASSGVAILSEDYSWYQWGREPASGTNWGEPFQFPVLGGPIALAYRPGDFPALKGKKIQLSTWTYCAIANGTVTNWNDPAITSDNGASITGGKSATIRFFYNSYSGGANYYFTHHLSNVCGSSWSAPYNASPYQNNAGARSAAWTYGPQLAWNGPGCNPEAWGCPSPAPPGPNFSGAVGDAGVVASIQVTKYSVGYVGGQWAASASPALAQAALQSAYPSGKDTVYFADPTNHATIALAMNDLRANAIQYGMGADNLPLSGDTRPDCAFYINPDKQLVKTPFQAYPIMAINYMMFYGNNNGVHTNDKKTLISYMLSAPASAIINKMEYAPVSTSIQTAVHDAFHGVGSHPSPCLQ